MQRKPSQAVLASAGLGMIVFLAAVASSGAAEKPAPVPPASGVRQTPGAIAEAKRLVRMMDDIYFAGVLTTHRMYVHDAGTPAAVAWAKQVMRQVNKKGWPQARIFATHDRPLHPENVPVEAFERDAIQAFRKGSPTLERVEGSTVRFAREIRIVDRSCLTCHVRNKEGDLVGGVSYKAVVRPAASPVSTAR